MVAPGEEKREEGGQGPGEHDGEGLDLRPVLVELLGKKETRRQRSRSRRPPGARGDLKKEIHVGPMVGGTEEWRGGKGLPIPSGLRE